MTKKENFTRLGLSGASLEAIACRGFDNPTEIQSRTIPLLLAGEVDIVGQARTGTGKTAAFGLPIIEKIAAGAGHVQALVLVPTRELALQVCDELKSFRGKKKLQITPVYGGQSMSEQLRLLKAGVDVVVGTPGRVLDHLRRKSLRLERIAYAVLDEADEMLNMGFIDDVETILGSANPDRRTLLFSATMPGHILALARKYMSNYTVVSAPGDTLTVDAIEQVYYSVRPSDRLEALCRIIDCDDDFYGLVFCRTRADVDELTRRLLERGYAAEGIHGEFSQPQRERTLEKFRNKLTKVLVATDVAARGIDISCLSHVVNYTLPQEPETYVHRIGRTGRAGEKGTAVSFVETSEHRKLAVIMKLAKAPIVRAKVPAAEDIVRAKKDRVRRKLEAIMADGVSGACMDAARDLCGKAEPVEVLAALMKYSFGDELDPRAYREIREPAVPLEGHYRDNGRAKPAHDRGGKKRVRPVENRHKKKAPVAFKKKKRA